MLWVRALGVPKAQVLPGTEAARRPFWSPDSRSIGFFANSELRRIEARGGSARTVAYALGGTTAAWGSDGTILFSGADAPVLRRVNADGGSVESATSPSAASSGHRHPQFLPGGRQFLFFAGGPDAVRGVYMGSLDSPEVTRLTASDSQGAYVSPGWLLFVRQGTLLAQPVDLARRMLTRRADHDCGLRCGRAIYQHGRVLDIECGSACLPCGAPRCDTSFVVRSIGQGAWHLWIFRADRPHESSALPQRGARDRRAHAAERNGFVDARCRPPDALYARNRWSRRAPAAVVADWRSNRVRVGRFRIHAACRESINRRWRPGSIV